MVVLLLLLYWIRICRKSHNTVTNHNYILCVVRILMKQTLGSHEVKRIYKKIMKHQEFRIIYTVQVTLLYHCASLRRTDNYWCRIFQVMPLLVKTVEKREKMPRRKWIKSDEKIRRVHATSINSDDLLHNGAKMFMN